MIKHMDMVSIIMPVYNALRFIDESVQSVISQTWKNWELIIVNDGSTDGINAYLDDLEDARIRVIHQEHQGSSAARNAALEVVRGKFITFLDADDILPSRSLELRASYLELNRNIDLVDGQIVVKDSNMKNVVSIYKPYYTGRLFPRLVALDNRVFFGICYMFEKQILDDVRFAENMTNVEDLLFYMELSSRYPVRYGFVNEPVYWCRRGHASVSTDLDGLERSYKLFLSRVEDLTGVSSLEKLFLGMKITRIMFLSWLKNNNYKRALLVVASYLLSFK